MVMLAAAISFEDGVSLPGRHLNLSASKSGRDGIALRKSGKSRLLSALLRSIEKRSRRKFHRQLNGAESRFFFLGRVLETVRPLPAG
jgi:hypothetical protein